MNKWNTILGGVSKLVGRIIWKGFLFLICAGLCIAGFSSFFAGDIKSLLPSVIFLALTLFMLRKPIASFADWRKRTRARPLAAEPKTTIPTQTVPATTQTPKYVQVHTQKVEPEETLSLDGATLSYLDAKALKYWDGKPTDFEIPAYYAESAFGRNVKPALRRLLDGSFLTTGDIQKSITRKTVPELKSILTEKGLKVSGKKDELIQRLMENLSSQELHKLFPVGVYEITSAGERALDEYAIIFENEDYQLGFSYYRLIQEKDKNPQSTGEAILYRLINEDIQECYRTGDKSRYQLIVPNAARYVMGHGDPELALDLYILVYFIWIMDLKSASLQIPSGQNCHSSKYIEDYGKLCGLSFSQLLERFRDTIHKNNPFGLANKRTVEAAVILFRKGLGVS